MRLLQVSARIENSIVVNWLSDSSVESVRCAGVTGRKVSWLLLGPRPEESSRNEDTGLGSQTHESAASQRGQGRCLQLPSEPSLHWPGVESSVRKPVRKL